MSEAVLELDVLPRRSATDLRRNWGEVRRDVQAAGSVAITSHETIEMVLLSPREYQRLVEQAAEAQAQQEAVLARLTSEFDKHLASLQRPEARDGLGRLFETKGKVADRPKAGSSF